MFINYPKFDRKYAQPIRRAWINALRSEKYARGIGCLVNAKGECCPLGVLCNEFYEMYPGRVKLDKDRLGRKTFDEETFIVPHKICEIVGLFSPDGSFIDLNGEFDYLADDFGHVNLSELNDYGDLNFKQVADLIENPRHRVFIA